MSKRFSRNIWKADETEPKHTNQAGDFLVDDDDAHIRLTDDYHCLTDNIKSLTSDYPEMVGVQTTGKNSRRLKINKEILDNKKLNTSGLISKQDHGKDGITLGLGFNKILQNIRDLNSFLEIHQDSKDTIAEHGEVDEFIRLTDSVNTFNVPTYKYTKRLEEEINKKNVHKAKEVKSIKVIDKKNVDVEILGLNTINTNNIYKGENIEQIDLYNFYLHINTEKNSENAEFKVRLYIKNENKERLFSKYKVPSNMLFLTYKTKLNNVNTTYNINNIGDYIEVIIDTKITKKEYDPTKTLFVGELII